MIERLSATIDYVIRGVDMNYTSFVLMACVLFFLGVLFLLRNCTVKMAWVLIASLVFYVWAGSRAGFVIIFMTAMIVYLITRRMESIYKQFDSATCDLSKKEAGQVMKQYKKRTKRYLILALVLIAGVWVYVKAGKLYEDRAYETFMDWLFGKGIIVPLGISYYSLSSIGYLLDVYWRKARPEHNFFYLFTAMTYFPHIVQGPIGKYDKLIKQLHNIPKFDYTRVCYGLQLAIWGYIKKMVIADRLGMYTTAVFGSPASYAGFEILLALFFSIFQLYADFSGCMDIVGGISQAVGIDLDVNFRQPFLSKNVSEFWRRWHITLGAWSREYLYLPVSTNPKFIKWAWNMKKSGKEWISSFIKELAPLIVVWLFTGLWHGTGFGYIAWGLYFGALILISIETKSFCDKLCSKLKIDRERKYWRIWQSVRTCIFFAIGRMFTIAGGLSGFALLWRRLFAEARLWTIFDGSLFTHGLDEKDFLVAIIGIIVIILVDLIHEKGIRIRERIAAQPLPLRWIIYLSAIFAVFILGIYGPGYDAASFIYEAF